MNVASTEANQVRPLGQKLEHVFLDMDGVLTDFVSAALQLHDRSDLLDSWPKGERDIPKVLNLTRTEYWKNIDAQGTVFWTTLQPFPWFSDLVNLVREFAPLTILTAPSLSPASLEGKVSWLYAHFPKVKGRRFTDYLIGQQKHLLAARRRVLIDDSEEQVEEFRSAGGQAILFPQVWNSNFEIPNRLEYVRQQLQIISEAS